MSSKGEEKGSDNNSYYFGTDNKSEMSNTRESIKLNAKTILF